MKITIIGGGNMGSAIAYGIADSTQSAYNVCVIDPNSDKCIEIRSVNSKIETATNNYNSLTSSDIIVIAVKPWLVEEVLKTNKEKLNPKQIIISIAAGITLDQLISWIPQHTSVYRVIPNTAIAIKQSMTFIASKNGTDEQNKFVLDIFNQLGKAEIIDENSMSAATALSSCGIAYAFRYIRAAMEGGVEMGLYPNQSKDILIQTLRGAIELLETNQSHPETEIDKVTTAGGITIKGLNEMEHAGFTSAVIRGLKASHVK